MATFSKSIEKTLKAEGGYIHDPDDPGGETYRGISRRANPRAAIWKRIDLIKRVNPGADRRGLSAVMISDVALNHGVREVYRRKYWRPLRLTEFPDQSLAGLVFDMSVNLGPKRAARLLQFCAGLFVSRNVHVDGIVGPQTLGAVRQSIRDKRVEFINTLNAKRIEYYFEIAESNPRLAKFLRGWIRRSSDFIVKN